MIQLLHVVTVSSVLLKQCCTMTSYTHVYECSVNVAVTFIVTLVYDICYFVIFVRCCH